MDKNKVYTSFAEVKKDLSDELLNNLRETGNLGFETLLDYGYSRDELMEMITSYYSVSGADIVNCNNSLKTLKKSLSERNINLK